MPRAHTHTHPIQAVLTKSWGNHLASLWLQQFLPHFLFLYPSFSIFSNYSGPVKGLQGCDCSVTISHSCCKIFTTILSTDFVKREKLERLIASFPNFYLYLWWKKYFIISYLFSTDQGNTPFLFHKASALWNVQWLYLPACYGTMTLGLLLNFNSKISSALYASTCINDHIFPSHK